MKNKYTKEQILQVLESYCKITNIDYFEHDAYLNLKIYFQFDEEPDVIAAIDFICSEYFNKEKHID